MGVMNVFCMIAGVGLLFLGAIDLKLGNSWKIWAPSFALSALNLYLAFEPAINGRIPFAA